MRAAGLSRLLGKEDRGQIHNDPAQPGVYRRIVNTVLLLLLFRVLANIPLANVDEDKLQELLKHNPLLGAIDLFAGGEVLAKFSVVAVGLFPYLVATGLVALAARFVPRLRALEKDSEGKRFKLYTRMLTIPLAFVLAWALTHWLSVQPGLFPKDLTWFTRSSLRSTLLVVSVMTAGSWFTDKIKDWITDFGIANGESVILLAGSSLSFGKSVSGLVFSIGDTANALWQLAVGALIALFVILVSVPLVTGKRNIPVLYPTRAAGTGRFAPPQRYLPLLINRGGIAPVSSAIGLLVLIKLAASGLAWLFPGRPGPVQSGLLALTGPQHGIYWVALAAFIIAFTYITNFTLLWKPYKDSDNSLATYLKQDQSHPFIPGVRPGKKTEEYLSRVMSRITLPAALTLAFLAAGLPYILQRLGGSDRTTVILAIIVFTKTSIEVKDGVAFYRDHGKPLKGFITRQRKRPSGADDDDERG